MSSILFDIKDNVAIITLNRPDKYNAFNREMALGLQEKLDECKASKNIRAIYITGAGKAFSSGQDLEEVSEPTNGVDVTVILKEHYNPIIKRIRYCSTQSQTTILLSRNVSAGSCSMSPVQFLSYRSY